MTAPNIVNVSTIIGRTVSQAATVTATAFLTNAAASGKVLKVNVVSVANIDGVYNANITIDLYRSATANKIANTITVPADATLVVISKDTAIYLEEGDSLRCTASADGDLQVTCSYEEIS